MSVWCDRIAQNALFCVVTAVRRLELAGFGWSSPGLMHQLSLCGFSAGKGVDGWDEPCCVLEQEGVAGIVKQKQLRAGHAAG